MVRAEGGRRSPISPPPTEAEVKKRKFVSAVREAEKSILVFKLNLGQVPIMNTSTISRKVTEDITAKAALVEERPNGRPSEDTVAMLEDTLSMVKGMDFFGKVTKLYKNIGNDKDLDNSKFCTLPVKMSFKDKDAKARAETVLRSACKLQCSTPYPLKLRQVIKQILGEQKLAHPKDFVQVRVDAENLSLKVSRKSEGKWFNNVEIVALSADVIDMGQVTNTVERMDTATASAESSAL